MHGSWCWSFLVSQLAANRWTPFSRLFAAIGGKHISAGVTSCSCAANATARRASSMLGMPITASGFSVAANALASPISLQWATDGTVRRVVSRSYALGSNGARTVPCRSNRAACMNGRINVSWGCLPITRPCESRGELCSKIQARSALCPSMAAMPKQICGPWRFRRVEISQQSLHVFHFQFPFIIVVCTRRS